jgi:ABC-type phosphate transport system ATPase subunit
MRGTAIILVGGTGAGKTTLCKRLLARVHPSRHLIYDVNGEYYDPNENALPAIDDFLAEAQRVRERVIVFEESTIFFNNRGRNDQMTDILVRKRHTRNIVIMVFHSIRAIPHYIFDLVNYVYVLKTNDTADLLRTKHGVLLPAFLEVQKMPPTKYPRITAKLVKLN